MIDLSKVPEKESFTITEVAKRWECEVSVVEDYILQDLLRRAISREKLKNAMSFKPFATLTEFDSNFPDEWYYVTSEHGLSGEQAFSLADDAENDPFNLDPDLHIFPTTKYLSVEDLHRNIIKFVHNTNNLADRKLAYIHVSDSNPVITREERDRFEKEYAISDKSNIQNDKACGQLRESKSDSDHLSEEERLEQIEVMRLNRTDVLPPIAGAYGLHSALTLEQSLSLSYALIKDANTLPARAGLINLLKSWRKEVGNSFSLSCMLEKMKIAGYTLHNPSRIGVPSGKECKAKNSGGKLLNDDFESKQEANQKEITLIREAKTSGKIFQKPRNGDAAAEAICYYGNKHIEEQSNVPTATQLIRTILSEAAESNPKYKIGGSARELKIEGATLKKDNFRGRYGRYLKC